MISHKKRTGYHLRSEQVTGSMDEFKGKSKAQLLAECRAWEAKYLVK